MKFNFQLDQQLKTNRFARLGSWYILALSMVASIIIAGQVLIQNHLRKQVNDSHIVNIAGKQRMLSQKMVKTILLLRDETIDERKQTLVELKSVLALWRVSHDALLHGNDSLRLVNNNSVVIDTLFAKVSSHFELMYRSAQSICNLLNENPAISYDSLRPDLLIIMEHESAFLQGMEIIVSQYDKEAQQKVAWLSSLEYVLLFISLLVLVLEIIFIFRPTAVHINQTVNDLLISEKNAKKLTNEIRTLYASLEKSYEQISQINQPIENPRLYAKADQGGNVIFIASSFAEWADQTEVKAGMQLCDLFAEMENPDDWMDEVIDCVTEGKNWKGEICFLGAHRKEYWTMAIVTPVYNERQEIEELLLMGADITRRKSAEQKLDLKNQAEIDKRINQQKFRSVLILEGQEEERKRIAMDIHDGIGQMLTSLKYHVESIDITAGDKAAQKLSEIDQLIKLIIKEVRKVTFNLKPTVLGDYGLQAALNVFVKEMSKLIDTKLVFHSEGEIARLPQKVEDNIFRIIQEAINNAIKYSEAESVDVILKQEENDLTVIVSDKGKGFDTRRVEERSVNIESGRGLFNMYERTEYINGTLTIESELGKGTMVALNVPVHSFVSAE